MYDVGTDDQLWQIMALVLAWPHLITAVVAAVVVFEAADGRLSHTTVG